MKTLRGRLILTHILPILIILPVMSLGLFYLLGTQVLIDNLSSEMTSQAELVANSTEVNVEVWYDPGRAGQLVSGIAPSLMAQLTLIDASGHILESNDPQYSPYVGNLDYVYPGIPSSPITNRQLVVYSKSEPHLITQVLQRVIGAQGELLGYILLSNPFTTVNARFQSLRQLILLITGAGLLAGLALGLFLAISLERPLRRTTQAVNRLANGEQFERLPERGPEELQVLEHAFNVLVERLRSLEASRRKLLANLVHELGRPLGALQSGVQALLGGADEDPALRKDLLQGIDQELSTLRKLLDELAHLHDQVIGNLEMDRETTRLEEWLPQALSPWREAALRKDQRWEMDITADLPAVAIDQERIGQALGNLLSNAIRYTASGGWIMVRAVRSDGEVRIDVVDSGPGVPTEDQERIFEPFYRGRAARRFADGMGLGLSIARDLVAAHGGRLTLSSHLGQGSDFTIHLPAAQPEAAQVTVTGGHEPRTQSV